MIIRGEKVGLKDLYFLRVETWSNCPSTVFDNVLIPYSSRNLPTARKLVTGYLLLSSPPTIINVKSGPGKRVP
jgi:hypothetical protein